MMTESNFEDVLWGWSVIDWTNAEK